MWSWYELKCQKCHCYFSFNLVPTLNYHHRYVENYIGHKWNIQVQLMWLKVCKKVTFCVCLRNDLFCLLFGKAIFPRDFFPLCLFIFQFSQVEKEGLETHWGQNSPKEEGLQKNRLWLSKNFNSMKLKTWKIVIYRSICSVFALNSSRAFLANG